MTMVGTQQLSRTTTIVTLFVALFAPTLCTSNTSNTTTTNTNSWTRINSVLELDAALTSVNATTTPNMTRVGFLSEGNYHSVKHLLSPKMSPVYYTNVSSIVADVVAGNLIAGLSVNRPGNASVIEFGSGAVAVRGFMFKRSPTAHTTPIQAAINGAVVHLAESDALRQMKQQYYTDFGIDTVEVRTCAGGLSTYHAFAEEARNTTITIGGIGPFNWGNLGNYQASPWTGLFPDYMVLLASNLQTTLNITLEWKWYNTSQQTMEGLDAGDIDCTDMYWTQPALFTHGGVSVSRLEHFDWSCAVLGTDNVFFTAVPAPPPPPPQLEATTITSGSDGYSAATIGGIAAAGAVVVGIALVVIVVMVRREKAGYPLFAPEDQSHLVTNDNNNVGFATKTESVELF
eukprot:m.256881 g.256881  ORF g.256881 m.256881 type:complete len:401 (-) comp34787_c0_seq1:314-1516(-)